MKYLLIILICLLTVPAFAGEPELVYQWSDGTVIENNPHVYQVPESKSSMPGHVKFVIELLIVNEIADVINTAIFPFWGP